MIYSDDRAVRASGVQSSFNFPSFISTKPQASYWLNAVMRNRVDITADSRNLPRMHCSKHIEVDELLLCWDTQPADRPQVSESVRKHELWDGIVPVLQ